MAVRATLRTALDQSGIGFYPLSELIAQFADIDTLVGATTTAVTATADGLTTGLIPANAGFVTVTASDANHIITLPAAAVGMTVRGWVGANGCEARTPAASGATINGVDSDGTNEAAIPATTLFTFTCVAANTWILEAVTELGAVITAIVPDAA